MNDDQRMYYIAVILAVLFTLGIIAMYWKP